ncbi:hypothetical protein E5358_11085 [Palleniella muris]|uniref:Uncharacterized protein n=1 Tax=Palleniella muris TaxID=3038145 RepID=A0AC61QNC0_9BACT|nr:DUF6261 family protein [Palleniella muris]TGX81157.1 hypothetical protein E5358_11085 [Palleniella muris]
MKEIATISLERMNNGAHFLFVSNVIGFAEASRIVKEKAQALISALKEAVAKEDKCLQISHKSMLTADIEESDAERDALYNGYKSAVKGYLSLPSNDYAERAKKLWQHLKDYGLIPQLQLDRETGMLMNFITDLEGKYKEDVAALNLTPFVAGMKAANNRVREMMLERTENQKSIPVGALKGARKIADNAYRKLVSMINALATVEGAAEYSPFIEIVNAEILHFKRDVLRQHSFFKEVAGLDVKLECDVQEQMPVYF